MRIIKTVFETNNYYRVFLVFSLVISFMMTNNTFAASTLTLTSSGSQSINVTASTGSTISADAINVATTCRYGYNLTLSTSVNDNNLYLNGDSSNNTAGTYFEPTDGTSALNATTNKWGYYYNASTTPTSTSVFLPVPTLASPATIKTPLDSPASSDINDSFNVYYGASVSPTMSTGTYKMIPDTNNSNNDGTLVYTATVADTCSQYTVHFSPTSIFEGNTLSGTGTMNDQSIYEGVATALTSNGFTAPSGYYFAGWNTAQDGSGTQYTNGQQVTDLTTAGSSITLYAMWTDCPPNTICYSPNVSNPSDIEGQMGNQTITSSATSAVLYATNFSRSNYGFAGWNTKADGTGTNYGPNQTIEFTAGTYNTGGLKLYTKWIASAGTMQSFSVSDCNSMDIGDVTARKDARDNNTYAVAKLADGKCWMIENLRLENTGTDNTSGSLAQGYNSSFIGLAAPESANFDSNGVANSLYSTDGSTAVTISGSYQGYRFPRYNNFNTQSRQSSSGYSADGNTYSMGNYYTWSAAIADTTQYSVNGDHNTTSICPTGWRIPTGDTTSEFYTLNTAVNSGATDSTASNNLRSYPNNFLFSGYFNGSSVGGRGTYASYWSSTSWSSSFYSYGLYIIKEKYSSYVSPDGWGDRYRGNVIRCILGS